MEKLDYIFLGEKYEVRLKINTYSDNGNLYVGMNYFTDGEEEPFCDVTVNLSEKLPAGMAYIDTNNMGNQILDWMEQKNLGHCTGERRQSGYCTYPLFQFDMREVMKII